MIPLVEEVTRYEADHDQDGPLVMEWLEDVYVCPEHGEMYCGAPAPAWTEHFCEDCARDLPRKPREDREDRDWREP